MRKHSLFLTIGLTLFATLSAWAAVPFKVTTIVDGNFAGDTQWYTMQIGSSKSVISDNGEADHIALQSSVISLEDANLWCFVGNDTDGYKIYNKQAGPTKCLSSSTDMNALAGYGGTGGSTYPVMKEALPEGWSNLWDFSASDKIADVNGFFIKIHGTDYAVNNFGGIGKLAFWAEGQDAGSTVIISMVESIANIKEGCGSFTASNANGTWHSRWESTEVPGLTLSANANNMQYANGNIAGYSGTSGSCTYTLTAPEGYIISAYSFDFVNTGTDAYELTLTAGGTTYKSSATQQHVAVADLEERTVSFVQSGANKGLTFSNFTVTITRSIVEPEPQYEVFTTTTTSVPYRIPAITKAYNGDLIAVADYRHSGADIGMATNGRIDIHARISKDNGKTWGDIFPIVEGLGENAPDLTSMYVAFGDPCLVADKESSKVMLLTCSGNVSFPNGQRNNHQGIARFYSEDNGQTWSEPIDISEAIYEQFDKRVNGGIRCMFIGSGKISQSSTVKVGDYYRLYCAPLVKLADGSNVNFVLYSDDFGGTWKVLGGVDVSPIPSGGDEPKADELPDGSVIISSRTSGGRIYNIYNFTSTATGEGSWGTSVWSNSDNNGTVAVSNSTNGEIMIVPVVRNADSKKMFLMLQSVPFGSGRANVGIYYKELESLADFATPDSIAKNWDGRHQSSYIFSAYSTMCMQADNTIGFIYEEETHCNTSRGGYTIVYKNYSIDYLTDSLYTFCADVDRDAFVASNIDVKAAAVLSNVGPYVGNYLETASEALNGALEAYKAAPSKQGYEALNAAIAKAPRVEVEAGKWYTLRNFGRSNGTLYMTPEDSRFTVATGDASDADQLFSFTATDTEGVYNLYNGNYGLYLGKLGANETHPAVHETPEDAGRYTVIASASGLSGIACQNKTGGHAGIHLAGDDVRLVPWTTNAEASLWYIQPVEAFNVTIPEAGYATMCVPFAVSLPEGVKAYAAIDTEVVDGVECLVIEAIEGAVPAQQPVILNAAAGNYTLGITTDNAPMMTTALTGVLKAASASNSNAKIYTLNGDKFVKATGSSVALTANSAYLVSESSATELPLSVIANSTGIEGATTIDNAADALYDLNGKLVKNPTTGIYITGKGKKVFITR